VNKIGDIKRFPVFAGFIKENFPRVQKIADVAGGHGNLSYYLRESGFDSTVIDTRDARLPRRLMRILRKQSVKQGVDIQIRRLVGEIQTIDLEPFDLIAALHPDQATEHAIRAAIRLEKNFAVVPCCVFPIDGIKRSQEKWVEHLMSLSDDIQEAQLPIEGANRVLYRSAA
jgi:hypothetical protein